MTDLTHNAQGEFEGSLDHMELAAEAARLRATGLSYRQIAAAQGITAAGAHDRVKRALAAVPVEAVTQLRQVELERLDALVAKAFDVMTDSHPYVSQGKVFYDLEDSGPVVAAIRELRMLSESRRKLLGLDAPTQVNLSLTDPMLQQIQQMEAELGLVQKEPLQLTSVISEPEAT